MQIEKKKNQDFFFWVVVVVVEVVGDIFRGLRHQVACMFSGFSGRRMTRAVSQAFSLATSLEGWGGIKWLACSVVFWEEGWQGQFLRRFGWFFFRRKIRFWYLRYESNERKWSIIVCVKFYSLICNKLVT